jgi:hypothetical protein
LDDESFFLELFPGFLNRGGPSSLNYFTTLFPILFIL